MCANVTRWKKYVAKVLCEKVEKLVYNIINIHMNNDENNGKTINPPSYPHCPQEKSIFLLNKKRTNVLVKVMKTLKKKRK